MIMEYTFTEANFEQEVLNSEIPVVVDFFAEWCGPCKMLAPTVEALAEKYAGRVKIGKLDSDEAMTLCRKYRVMSIPNVLFFKGGNQVDKVVGAQSKDKFIEKIEALL
jgi:thioredoxin 1